MNIYGRVTVTEINSQYPVVPQYRDALVRDGCARVLMQTDNVVTDAGIAAMLAAFAGGHGYATVGSTPVRFADPTPAYVGRMQVSSGTPVTRPAPSDTGLENPLLREFSDLGQDLLVTYGSGTVNFASLIASAENDNEVLTEEVLLNAQGDCLARALLREIATGSVTFSTNPADGDYVEITDDASVTERFEFDDDLSVTGGNVRVVIGGSAAATMTNLLTAITGTALNVAAELNPANNQQLLLYVLTGGAAGNQTITRSGASIAVAGLAGGTDGVTKTPGVGLQIDHTITLTRA